MTKIVNYYDEIKQEFINNEIYKKVKDYSKTRSDLNTYYNVGKLLEKAGKKYGEGIIKEYSERLTMDFGKGYSVRNLYNMKLFFQKVQTVSAKLTWSHYCEILSLTDRNEFNYYVRIVETQNLSVRQLKVRIKNDEYKRLPYDTREKITNDEMVNDFIKNPILIKNSYGYNEISEKILKRLILDDIDEFLKELGENFSYLGNEYKIKLGDRYNYIDLLLYNVKFKCYVVVELKVTELKAEYIGQIQKYMNYIDKNIKSLDDDKTIGIIICRKDNKFVMEYCSDERIYSREYVLK